MSQRHKLDSGRYNNDYMPACNVKRRGRHRSRSRSPFYHRKHYQTEKSYSRSRSRSSHSNRRRHNDKYSRSRSRSGSSGPNDRYNSARRHKNSKESYSISKSRSRSPVSHKTTNSTRKLSSSPTSKKSKYSGSSRIPNPERHGSRPSVYNIEKCVSSTSSRSYDSVGDSQPELQNLPLPKSDAIGIYYNLNIEEPIDKERIHKEIEEKLRQTLAKEGKVYPPPKAEASHPVFANDGSFLEVFKKMQESQQQNTLVTAASPTNIATATVADTASSLTTATPVATVSSRKVTPAPPMVGRRRGGKILKTGVVAKPKTKTESNADPKDFWSLYLAEVNKYKNNACESDGGTRPLVK